MSQAGNLDANMIFRQYKKNSTTRFMEIKSINPRMEKDQKAKELGSSSGTSQRYGNDSNVLSLDRIPPEITNKRRRKISNANLDDDA